MPTWGKVLLGIIVVIVIIVVAIFSFASGMTKTADRFFAAVRKGDIDQAYNYTSPDFKAGTTKDAMAAFLKANALDKVTGTSWGSRSFSGRTGKLEGSLTIATGGVISIKIDLAKGSDGWKIFAIRKAAAGLQSGDTSQQLPSEQQQIALVQQSMSIFTDGLAAGSMTELHNYISKMWARQISIEDMDRGFSSLYPYGSAFQVLKTMTPIFDEPTQISDQGVMSIKGHYATTPEQMNFTAKYFFEGTGWKLFGLSVKMEAVTAK